MSDGTRAGGVAPIVVDLATEEKNYFSATGRDFTEAKEAIVEALLRMTERKCSGADRDGEVIYGVRPSSKLVSGFLMPRFDSAGEDETSDIHIATMGVDLQVTSAEGGEITIRPELSIYVRELPSWAEISDLRFEMMPRVQLSQQTRQSIEQRARAIIQEKLSELPPVEEEAEIDADQAGDAIARAETAHEGAEVADEQKEQAGSGDTEARGTSKAANEAADRAGKAARAHRLAALDREGKRKERAATVSAIRREAFDRAFAELGIQLVSLDDDRRGRAVTSDDLEEEKHSEVIEAGIEDAISAEKEQAEAADAPASDEAPPPAAGAVGALRSGAGTIEDRFAAPQPIPQKWRRWTLQLGDFRFQTSDEATQAAAVADFRNRLRDRVSERVAEWLATEDGQAAAYRPNERVLPSQFANEESWNRFLAELRGRRQAVPADVTPDIVGDVSRNVSGVELVIEIDPDFADATRLNLRIALQNDSAMPSGRDASAFEHAIFQVKLEVDIPARIHRPLQLDRVRPSYRFMDWLTYPAMGLNCGVEKLASAAELISLATTWSPHYTQPRIDPRKVGGVPTAYAEFAKQTSNVDSLLALPDAYDAWISTQASLDVGASLPQELADEERASHQSDIEAYRRESRNIRAGIILLRDSKAARETLDAKAPGDKKERNALLERAAPWDAWLRTNETFADYGQRRFTDWRLFQLAFILAHLPTFASRTPSYADRFDAHRDELSASLLYFPTGGGKSEAFFGLLIFNLFFDRLRGKHRGVTTLVRYPLRLLTLQQARRLTRILVRAELVRLRHRITGWPFELGFWVGSGNTPNRAAQGFGGVPAVTVASHCDDTALLNPPTEDTEAAAKERRRSARYKEALESYDKLRTCPCCGSPTGMRKYPSQHGRIGIVCFNDKDCAWNAANPSVPHRVPLPFLLTDDTIYQRAPSIVLGTVDKLALIGQHDRTINAIVGMFGAARYLDPQSQHLFMPRGQRALQKAADDGWTRVSPAFDDGVEVLHDPFPSMIIQDEGHLLDESLGTFSGLFETTLERILCGLADTVLRGHVATWEDGAKGEKRPRLAKVIAATATISDPDRQLRVLYQREPLRFPCPGPNLYESFYSAPREPIVPARRDYSQSLATHIRPERASPRMRTYVSIMTNGRSHTMTTSAVISAYHLSFLRLWRLLDAGRGADAIALITGALPASDPLTPLRADALSDLARLPNGTDIIASLLDLLRISLTYVTNKKGGDQIIETLTAQVERDQTSDGIKDVPFVTDLISGGVTIAEIQDVMARAEGGPPPGSNFLPMGEALRNIVATSAISHGVDVDKFNAMFFAGLPADIAEYIQASSRVGRTHVGFSMFVPTPHSRRDRYVVETHDQFHRFLERMIPPPAVQRWADRAIRRMMPSILQAYLCGIVEQELFAEAPAKERARTFTTAAQIKAWAEQFPGGGYPAAVRAVTAFAMDAVGVFGRGPNGIGASTHAKHYQRFVEERIHQLLDIFTARSDASQLSNFWSDIETRDIRRPMTSLRDVDAGGTILGATRDPYRNRNVHLETVRQVMKVIRGQRLAVRSELDADPAPVDAEDR
jgi:hypothetical protein